MYVKSIVLEGFKSYGTRQEIHGFDPEFNAITGLNGSGKSNILDSICFVLGIQNLQQVRATNLTELVYKNGQAGINKAVVSITFDNSDPHASPLGYENQKEIVVSRTVITGGKTKYLINGVSANNNRVHDLFQSVQLNVNNPHFLIMQGRITKVLNMKPLEILSMIEEAAGTRMYEEKKETALRNLEKKDSKLREINAMLEEHINPQLEKLKEDRKEYTKYTKVVREYEHLYKIYIAWDYCQTEELVKKSGVEKETIKNNYEDQKKLIADLKKQLVEADVRIQEIEKKIDEDCGNKLKEIETELKSKQVTEAKFDTQLKNLKDAVNEERKKQADLIKNLKEEKASLAQKEKELSNSLKKLENLQTIRDKDNDAVVTAENHFHAVNAGLGDDGEEASLAAQLIAAGKDKKAAETEAKSLEMSIKHTQVELAKKEAENKKVDKSYSQDQALYQKLESEVKRLKADINKLNYQEGQYEGLLAKEKKLNRELSTYQEELESIFARFPQLSFDYVDPVKNFDRRKVRGPVCMQMEIKDSKEALALDVAASGKLYNVIVNDEDTGKLLLDKGHLKRRCTIIPLNKIRGTVIENKLVQEAENIVGKNNVALALSRINFEKDLTPAMEYVFGNVFICPSMTSAKAVTFSNVKKRSVTLDGEVFDPAGTLSGGSMGNRGKLLAEIAPLPKLRRTVDEKQLELNKLRVEIQNARKLKQKYDEMCEQYELKENEAQLLKSKIEQSTYHKQIEEFQKMKQSLEEQKSNLAACKEKQMKTEKLMKELEAKTSKSTRENKVKEAEKAVAESKKRAVASLEKFNSFQGEVDSLKMEIEGILEGLPACEEQIQASGKTIEECEKRLKEAEEKQKEIKEVVSNLVDELKKQKGVLKSHSSEISKIGKEKESMNKQIANAELQMQQLEHDIKNIGENSSEASKKLKLLLEKNKWIEGQKKFFNVPNSEFDFSSFNPKVAIPQLKELEELKEKLHRHVNMRAQNMLSSVEEQYQNLLQKKNIVCNDKITIENVIKELDEKKKTALRDACVRVDKDFGSIFRTLLPGSDAKLAHPSGDVLGGVEFKVAFGKVWKESLSELSGGQKSLVALSLILALLLFNPAPIYILDEVDAALDLSHTQNIGKMLKMHFKKSQFIVVSLKDGMFNNANVLFRTKFSDGMSSVSRTVQKNK
ncbi:structural maintenance of chromosomes protein 2 [Trichonephila inaurata madagascariensis]|uniref:Structural maintenance of chromosomes protein n=1 Tax=Trichonephila inaurata madagascariensis TaxID=2747483 RepID=A0A8X7CFN6_9ARAC|nr:structural maintenance of chromosomes protein 2 [Trichonephila inaurata madagascariensis]